MSLADQSQQWYPTSVQVTVLQARNLRIKGKNGTNDAYAIIQVAKDKFSTSVAEKCVAPVWKEEATFDLPMFHSGNADRCTLYVIIMHRALVGLDKLLGQAIINLLDLHDNKSRKKTDWYKLVDKSGKQDKDRGEVLLDVQFMRNNMTASMFDLSIPDKPRSRLSKLKDKVRGKKRDGLSDSASAVVPSSVGQVLTDSEEEKEPGTNSPKSKPSSKLKSLFTPKSNLHRGVSQSMSTLGSLPEKNSSLSSSRSSGLNVESPDVKRKFKFLGHKRTSSTDSKVSLGPFSLLNRSKQNIPENSLCINGSHVYAEEQEAKANSGSTLSLSSSARGSTEDLRKSHERNASDISADSFKGLSIPTYKPEPVERAPHVPRLSNENEDKKQKKADGRLQELLERQEEQDRRRLQEREEKLRRQEEEERKKMLEDQEKKWQQEEEQQRKRGEEEKRRAEEQKRHEEARMTERLSSLFGLGKKKEELNPPAMEHSRHVDVVASTNPFEEIPLSPDTTSSFLEGRAEDQPSGVQTTFAPTPPTSAFPGRTAKVSAVKPRSALSLKSETDNINPFASPVTSDIQNTVPASNLPPKPSTYNEPLDSFEMFSNLHSSMAPPKPQRIENLVGVDHATTKAEKKYKAPHPPSYPGDSSKNENHDPKHGSRPSNSQQSQRPPLPLPDYDALFPKGRHGVMTTTRWEHIVAEVKQRRLDGPVELTAEEMSVDGPAEQPKLAVLKEKTVPIPVQHHMDHGEKYSRSTNPMEPKQILVPPRTSSLTTARQLLEFNSKKSHIAEPLYATVNKSKKAHSHEHLYADVDESSLCTAKALGTDPAPNVLSQQEPQVQERKLLRTAGQNSEPKETPTPAARTKSTSPENVNTDNTAVLPSAKPRQRASIKEPVIQEQPVIQVPTLILRSKSAQVESKNEGSFTSKTLEKSAGLKERLPTTDDLPTRIVKTVDMSERRPVANVTSDVFKSDPFPNNKLISQDPWTMPQQKMNEDHLFAAGPKQTNESKDQFLTSEHFDSIFGPKNETDPFCSSVTPKHEIDPFFGSPALKDEMHNVFGTPASKHEMDPFFGSSSTSDEMDNAFGSSSSMDLMDNVVGSPAPKDEIDKAFGSTFNNAFGSPAPKDEMDNSVASTLDTAFGSTSSKDEIDHFVTYSSSSPSIQKIHSQKKKLAPQPPKGLEKMTMKKKITDKLSSQSKQDDVELTVTSVAGLHSGESTTDTSKNVLAKKLLSSPTQVSPSSVISELPSGSTHGGKSTLRAWVSPSEVQSVTSPSSAGGGVLTPRRPHPVKPMNTAESQPTGNISMVKDLKTTTIREVAEKSKTTEGGPYTQLTQEELITLVVKQQAELSKKDSKILELEDYIDNLLVRVIEEKPSILLALNSKS